MENRFLAKTTEENEKEITIKEHTQDLIKQYNILKEVYPFILKQEEWEILLLAILYHDLGKMNTKFQNMLYQKMKLDLLEDYDKNEPQVPHNMLSTYFIDTKKLKEKYGEENVSILASSVYYHHSREIQDFQEEKVLEDLKKQFAKYKEDTGVNISNIRPCSEKYIFKNDEIEGIKKLTSKRYIMIKGLLNKLDYIASARKENVVVEETIQVDGKTLKQLVEDNFKNRYRPVQSYMLEKKNENVIAISATGSGKTEAGLLWGGDSKLFYTLPYKVSIEAMLSRILKLSYNKAVLLHSGAYSYYKNKEDKLNGYDRARRLSSPCIVTTVDQIFRIAFRYQGYEEILATLSYSKIIIDEIQMYSPDLVAYILVGLSMITKVGGKFAILTATFPPILYYFMDQLKIPYIKKEEAFPSPIKRRHKIKLFPNTDFDISRIKEYAKKHKVLVIVNTVTKAQKIYEKLKGENAYLLHKQYLKENRQQLEEKILKFTDREQNQENGIWISTQIVEASLDIDFDVLFTDMCSIDSLFQRMGRVYRNREYLENTPNVYIYDTRNGVPKVINGQIYDWSLEQIKEHTQKQMEITEEDKQEMIKNIFDLERNKKLKESDYYQTIESNINMLEIAIPNEIEKKKIAQLFRDIRSIELIPENIYEQLHANGKIQMWKETLKNSTKLSEKLKIKEEISNYTISVQWTYNLIYDEEELFFLHSNIHRTPYYYEFDEETLQGRGLVKEIKKYSNIDE